MTYNRELRSFAPLPTGALPTQEEMSALTRRARHAQSQHLVSALRRVFKS